MKIYLTNQNTGGYGEKFKTIKKLLRMKKEVKISYYYDKKNLIKHIQASKK